MLISKRKIKAETQLLNESFQMMDFVFSLFLLLVFPLYCGGATPGVLQLDSKTFDKVSWTFSSSMIIYDGICWSIFH